MHSTRAVYMYQIAAAVIGPRRTLHVPAVACPLLFSPIVHGTRGHDELNVLIPYTVYVMDGSDDHPPKSKSHQALSSAHHFTSSHATRNSNTARLSA